MLPIRRSADGFLCPLPTYHLDLPICLFVTSLHLWLIDRWHHIKHKSASSLRDSYAHLLSTPDIISMMIDRQHTHTCQQIEKSMAASRKQDEVRGSLPSQYADPTWSTHRHSGWPSKKEVWWLVLEIIELKLLLGGSLMILHDTSWKIRMVIETLFCLHCISW